MNQISFPMIRPFLTTVLCTRWQQTKPAEYTTNPVLPQAMPYTYVPAQYIPANEMLVRVPRQLTQGPDGAPRRNPYAQDRAGLDQDTAADAAYGAAPVRNTLRKPCLLDVY